MRRLAVQSRDDGYSSTRDYQKIHEKLTKRIVPKGGGNNVRFRRGTLREGGSTGVVGIGGFLKTPSAISMTLTLVIDSVESKITIEARDEWTRFGIASEYEDGLQGEVYAMLEWCSADPIDVWGLEFDSLDLPESIQEEGVTVSALNASHLAPETYYLAHDVAISVDIDQDLSSPFHLETGDPIDLKKCSYCQRFLPLSLELLGSLSFHKHNAKLSKHQNECRACKKWRINNSFNPLRTTDQLHESSVITRERKILLREPEILQEIKERTGAGLKSQIWERFDRRCFVCGEELELSEVQLDHTRPLAYLWPIDEHATCLCAEHNNLKKDKFPCEFYTDAQLRRLSEITGLDYGELTVKDVNQVELDRIIRDIESFAKEWDARTFSAIARKVIEVRPEVDMFDILRSVNLDLYDDVIAQVADRPSPVA